MITLETAVLHYYNPYQKHYQKYRQAVEDKAYIAQNRKKERRKIDRGTFRVKTEKYEHEKYDEKHLLLE